ncbi:MAG: Y-family DNA polymerase [Pseudomonadales bacterium]
MQWLAMYYPALGLEAFHTATNDDPAVLVEQGQVVLCNRKASQLGVSPGLTAATANSIVADLKHVQRSPQRESLRLKALAEALYQLTPQIAIEPPAALLLEISASLRLFGDDQVITKQAIHLSEELGHQAHARLATTPAAALALATTGVHKLEQVPLAALNLSEQSVERFVNMGLKRLQDVLHLPAKELAQRFGTQALSQLQRLTGQQQDPKSFIRLSPEFSRTVELLDPIRSKQGLLFPMQRLAGELKHWLISRQLAVGQLRWCFKTATSTGGSVDESKNNSAVVIADFAQPHQNPQKMLQISQLRLEQAQLPADVLSLSLEAARLSDCQPHATDLFTRQQIGSAPNELLDQLKARLGNEACRRLETVEQHHPAWSSRQPLNNAFPRAQSSQTKGSSTPNNRPLWLRRSPQPVAAQELQLLHGPERIRTAWWRQGVCRDYYIALYRRRSQCWAFTDDSGNWFIHGYFA